MKRKINRLKLLVPVFALLTAACLAQVSNGTNETRQTQDARAVMLKFVELNNKKMLQTGEAQALLGGEAGKGWKMDWFGQSFNSPDKIIPVEDGFSVARIQAVEKNSRVVDLYFYLRRDAVNGGGWKIRSMRALAKTGFIETTIEALKSKSDLTEKEQEDLANARLVLSSDKTLGEWFTKNRVALDRLATLALLETKPKPINIPAPKSRNTRSAKRGKVAEIIEVPMAISTTRGNDSDDNEPRTVERVGANDALRFPKTAALLKKLHLSALEIKSDGRVEITIGGIIDNTVGFIFSPKEKPPPIDGWRYIWVEKVASRWHLFRTT